MNNLKFDHQLRIGENPCQDHVEDEAEAPSLCELPIIRNDKEEMSDQGTDDEVTQDDQDFEFGSLRADGSLIALEDDMCVADDIFYGGHILPLRHSISSFHNIHNNNNNNNNHPDGLTRTGSGPLDRSGSISSSVYRCSSYTSSSRSSSTGSRGKAQNPFHSYPSPSPQIRACPGTRTGPTCGPKKPNSKSTLWDLLRLGLVRAPPELPPRRSISYCYGHKIISRSSSSSSNSTVNGNGRAKKIPAQENFSPVEVKRNVGGGIFGGCKFSVDVVTNGGCGGAAVAAAEIRGGKSVEERRRVERRRRRRTFEWLKGVADYGVVLNPV